MENVNRFCEFAWSEVYAPYSSNAIANKVEAGEKMCIRDRYWEADALSYP